jgi:hypothetical protein
LRLQEDGIKEMTKLLSLSVFLSLTLIISILIGGQGHVYAEEEFVIDTKTTIKKVKEPIQYKLVVSANGITKMRITDVIKNPSSGTINIPVTFKRVNDDIVTAGYHDEYFACGYVISAKTGLAKKYKCNEEDLQDENGNNPLPLEEFRKSPNNNQNTGAKSVKIKVKVPLSDRPDVDLLKVVAMVKGEFKSRVINAEDANGKTVSATFSFDRNTGIGPIQVDDIYFACVAGDELNPPEGNECEFHKIKSLTDTNVIKAR